MSHEAAVVFGSLYVLASHRASDMIERGGEERGRGDTEGERVRGRGGERD